MKYRNNTVVTIEEIREIIDRRGLASQIKEGFDIQKEEHFTYIEVFHGDTKLILDLADEYTIYFGDWHGHYYTDEPMNGGYERNLVATFFAIIQSYGRRNSIKWQDDTMRSKDWRSLRPRPLCRMKSSERSFCIRRDICTSTLSESRC